MRGYLQEVRHLQDKRHGLHTNRGTAILRLVPESTRPKSRLEELYELGMATPPRKPVVAMSGRPPVVLSRPVEQILDDVNGDADVEFTR